MFVVASTAPLHENSREEIEQVLLSTPGGRLVLALVDKDAECKDFSRRLQESEYDRAARLDQIKQYEIWLKEAQAEITKFKNSPIYKAARRFGIF